MATPRKSAELHELHGTKPHDRAADLSHVPSGRPRFPKDLPASLKPTFKRMCSLLAERRTLTAGDAELIRLYCFQFDRHARNVELLRAEGEICSYTRLDSNGAPHEMVKPNYRLRVVTDAERQMAAILNQLGLTPTAKDRAKPTAAGPTAMKVIPGSIADIAPHLVGLAPKPPEPISLLTPELQEQLATMSFEADPEPDEPEEEKDDE